MGIISNIVNYLQMLMLNLGVLAPIKAEILFIFSLKIKRLQRKAGDSSKKKKNSYHYNNCFFLKPFS